MANPVVTFTMADGKVMKAELYPEVAPNTVNNFISLVKKKGRHHRLHNDKAASSGFGRKAGNTITLAVIFGLVAGLVFQAVNMESTDL